MFAITFCSYAQEQTKVVYGRAYTLKQLPVKGLTVTSKKGGALVTTDSTGHFAIVCHTDDIIVVSGKMFRTKKIKVKPNKTDSVIVEMKFPLTEENIDVAIGYGYISERDRTTAVSCLPKGKDYCVYTDIFELFRAEFTGLSVSSDCITIRGTSSLTGSTCALMIVDGKEVSSISHIHPCSVKSISIMKDAGTAIYGSRGGNGAIIINLKKGGD